MGRIVVVELGNVAATRRSEVCIDIVNGLTPGERATL